MQTQCDTTWQREGEKRKGEKEGESKPIAAPQSLWSNVWEIYKKYSPITKMGIVKISAVMQ